MNKLTLTIILMIAAVNTKAQTIPTLDEHHLLLDGSLTHDEAQAQPFVFGGEEGKEKFDKNVRYRGSLQNYLIDTGSEVILVDTGLPAGFPEEVPNEDSPIFTGKDISSYMDALKTLGYKPEQVTKILYGLRQTACN